MQCRVLSTKRKVLLGSSKGDLSRIHDVWSNSDGMEDQGFDAKIFFLLHDTNDDGFLDFLEVQAIMQKVCAYCLQF